MQQCSWSCFPNQNEYRKVLTVTTQLNLLQWWTTLISRLKTTFGNSVLKSSIGLQRLIMCFWTIGTFWAGISTPMSPRGTIKPSETAMISSKLSIPSWGSFNWRYSWQDCCYLPRLIRWYSCWWPCSFWWWFNWHGYWWKRRCKQGTCMSRLKPWCYLLEIQS